MKYLLLISLAFNGVLYWQLQQKPKVITSQPRIKWKTDEKIVVHDVVRETAAKSLPAMGSKAMPVEIDPATEVELDEMAEKMQEIRVSVLTDLGVSEEKIEEANQVKAKFNAKLGKLYGNESDFMNIDIRKKVIALEEQHMKDLAQIYGEKKFQQYQEHRKKYNQQVMKAYQTGDNNGQILMVLEL